MYEWGTVAKEEKSRVGNLDSVYPRIDSDDGSAYMTLLALA